MRPALPRDRCAAGTDRVSASATLSLPLAPCPLLLPPVALPLLRRFNAALFQLPYLLATGIPATPLPPRPAPLLTLPTLPTLPNPSPLPAPAPPLQALAPSMFAYVLAECVQTYLVVQGIVAPTTIAKAVVTVVGPLYYYGCMFW